MGSDELSERHDMMLHFSVLAFNRAPRIWVIVGSVIFLIFSTVNIASGISQETSKWQAEDAKILDTGVVYETAGSFDGWGYHPTIFFEWQIDGETHNSTSYSKKYVNFSTAGAAYHWLEDYPVGSNTTAYVNPNDHSDAVLITHTWIQMMGIGDFLYNLLCASTCLLLPLLALFTARSFEKTLPEHSHKRYKLVYDATAGQGQGGWDSSPEAMELQAMARSAWIKKNFDSLDMDEALAISQALDAQAQKFEGGSRSFSVLIDGTKEKEFEARSTTELLEIMASFGGDSELIYLEDTKEKGRQLEFSFHKVIGNVTKVKFVMTDPTAEGFSGLEMGVTMKASLRMVKSMVTESRLLLVEIGMKGTLDTTRLSIDRTWFRGLGN